MLSQYPLSYIRLHKLVGNEQLGKYAQTYLAIVFTL